MATVPDPGTVSVSEKVSAADWNRDVRDEGQFWVANRPLLMVYQTSAQSIPNNSYTDLTWDTETLDRDSQHSTASLTNRIVLGNTLGWYEIGGQVVYAANSSGARRARLQVNGTTPTIGAYVVQIDNASTRVCTVVFGPWLVQASSATDYISIQAFQDSGGALDTGNSSAGFTSHVCVKWVGRA